MTRTDYYAECISIAAEECGLSLTPEQHKYMAEAVEGGADNIGQAFYSPPASDRYAEIDREWQAKYRRLEQEFDTYKNNAERAVKKALRQHSDANVSIGEHGEVLRHGGRTEIIQ